MRLYTPPARKLSQITIDTDLTLAAYKLKFSTALIKELGAGELGIRDLADTGYQDLVAKTYTVGGTIGFLTDGGDMRARNLDTYMAKLMARETGIGIKEVARLIGATYPAFGIGEGGIQVVTRKFVRAHDSALFDAAGLTDSETLISLDVSRTILGATIVLNTQFVAPGLTDLDVTLGHGADNDYWLQPSAMNLVTDAVNTRYKDRGAAFDTAGVNRFHSDMVAYATAVGANLNTTTAGQITIYVTYLESQP